MDLLYARSYAGGKTEIQILDGEFQDFFALPVYYLSERFKACLESNIGGKCSKEPADVSLSKRYELWFLEFSHF